MKRVTSQQLATLAHGHPGSEIEVDDAAATQFLTLPDGRTFYASLESQEAPR